MGAQGSKPADPRTTKMRVLNLGFWRTGTTSTAEALSILLNEPVYHGGTHIMKDSIPHVSRWIQILRLANSRDDRIASGALIRGSTAEIAETMHIKAMIAQQLQGYAATTDAPMIYVLREMVELYPDAVFLVNTRDPEKWWQSAAVLGEAASDKHLTWQLWPLPRGVRYWPAYVSEIGPRLEHMNVGLSPETYTKYMEHVRSIIPEDRIRYYDVKEGWGPLCEILGVEVPKDVPFPHVNDTKAAREFYMGEKRKGLIAWAGILGTVLGAGVLGWRYLPKGALEAAWKAAGL